MRVMVFGMASDGAYSEPPSMEAFAAMDRFMEELAAAGVLVAAAGLKNDDGAKRVVIDGDDERTITDGPFAETKELVAGFCIWQVKDMDEAVAWVRRYPKTTPGRNVIEIRPFYEAEDLAEYISPEDLANPRQGERGRLGVA